jgi:2-amino-4-hydroxy-6-hydroxymethyldihydropteridine diphosphokinase
MPTTYLALGSNLGRREQYLRRSIAALEAKGITPVKTSTIIETEPMGGPPQGKYLNAVIQAATELSLEDLHDAVQQIEDDLGRRRQVINGPRVIDIDILLYDDLKMVTRRLTVPHPRMLERAFVMQPLLEIAPHLCESLPI